MYALDTAFDKSSGLVETYESIVILLPTSAQTTTLISTPKY